MAQQSTSRESWIVGLTFFAGILMITIGAGHIILGLGAVLNDDFYVTKQHFGLEMDTSAWGWVNMIGGGVVSVAGVGILAGRSVLARVIGVLVAGMSMIWSFYSIPYYPAWSITLIALDAAVIWALVMYGKEMPDSV